MGYTEQDLKEIKELESKGLQVTPAELSKNEYGGQTTRPIKYAQPKRHRNDPCSCGSGRKFKHCCEPKLDDGKRRRYYASKKQ